MTNYLLKNENEDMVLDYDALVLEVSPPQGVEKFQHRVNKSPKRKIKNKIVNVQNLDSFELYGFYKNFNLILLFLEKRKMTIVQGVIF